MKPDVAFSRTSSAQPARLPNLEAAFDRLFDAAARCGRSYATTRFEILIFRPDNAEPMRIALPAIVRGQLIADIVGFADLEAARPIEQHEIAS